MKNFINLYEVTKTVRFELKPSEKTLEKITGEDLFKSPHFQSKIFIKNNAENTEAEKKVKNYQFCINFDELKNLIEKCDEKFEKAKNIKNYLEENSQILWSVWIDPEKIKIIDKDLKYKLQEKNNWKKEFWNETTNKNSSYQVKWKKGSLFTLDDIDAYFEKVRSTQHSERKAGKFTIQIVNKISYLLHQYEIRKKQILLNDNLQDISFLKKKELVARMRNFLGMFLNLERTLSLFVPEYATEKAKFDSDLKNIFDEYKQDLQNIIQEIETIFKESDLYLHNNIQRRFSLNIRAINPNPESTNKTENQKITEEAILEKIEKLENEILELKKEKATIKGERKEKGQNHKYSEWNNIINQLNPSKKEGKFSKLTELRRDLEEVKITHYAVLIEKDGNFFLAMENKRKDDNSIKKTNEFSLLKLPQGDTCKKLVYNSLTFKALRRLCLEEKSSMKTDNFLNLPNVSWKEQLGNGRRIREVNRDWREPRYLKELKNYLKFTIKKNAEKIGVSFSDSQYKEWNNCKNLEELEILINKQGYQAKWQDISWEELLKKENVEIFQIFNKDFLLEENFATSEKDKEKIERLKKAKETLGEKFVPKQQKQDRKKDLFTIYWNNFIQDINSEEWRMRPEGKFYVRLKDNTDETQRLVGNDKKINKARFFENKIFADFGLGINSTIDKVGAKAKSEDEVEKHINNINELHKKDSQDFYILGLDRGLNSLVSYCLLDSNLQIIKTDEKNNLYEKDDQDYDKQKDFFCGDWSLVNSKGEFVKRENCKFNNRNDLKDFWIDIFGKLKMYYEFEKNNGFGIPEYVKQFKENEKADRYLEFGNNNNKIKFYILKEKTDEGKVFEIKSVKKEIQKDKNGKPLEDGKGQHIFEEKEENIWIIDNNINKVFDYVLSFYTEKAKRIFALYKQQTFDSSIQYSEKELEELLFESQDDLKEGFTNFAVGEIVELAQKIADTKKKKLYIVMEDLINYGNKGKTPTQNIDKDSFKKEEHERNLSVIIYQKLENNLVNKFNYVETKGENTQINKTQLSPKIKRIEDIKEFQGKNQLGNLFFIDPTNTSKQCPVCNHSENKNREKKNPLLDYIVCQNKNPICGFSTKENGNKKGFYFIDGGDSLASYNIAKRGIELLKNN